MRYSLSLAILCVNASPICVIDCENDVAIGRQIFEESAVADIVGEKSVREDYRSKRTSTASEVIGKLTVQDRVFLHLLLRA